MLPKISDAVSTIKPYEAGKPLKELEREFKIHTAVKLASNENPLGFSPDVEKAVVENLPRMNRYPEPVAHDLCRQLARYYRVEPQNIVLGNGSDDLIALLAHGFLDPGDQALMPLPSFLMYEISVKTAKGTPVMVPLSGFDTHLSGIAERVTPKTKMVFVTNPFNPTGSIITKDAFAAFADLIPPDVLIVVDEAYMEFVRNPDVFNSLDHPLADPRIVTLRTFSKAYGLAGFRIGYGIMDPEVAKILNRIRQPFNVNGLAQVAAEAALADQAFLHRSIETVHQGIDYLTRELSAMGFDPLPTQANFLMVDVKTDATELFTRLLSHGVIVRSMKSYGFETFLRVNAGTPEENQIFITALKAVLSQTP
ncbi:MAG TPA: histidinol-phosphate transaminase [Desulfotignum sp.]|jgi:histidinol-phosphate aminotransferase|nr:histidinol-phosphate transaminase [Desulfotignum sp.]